MSEFEKMEIFLSPEIAAALEEAVACGEYASASEVITDALRAWQTSRAGEPLSVEELRRLVQEGIDSGPAREISIEEIKEEVRRRTEVKKAASWWGTSASHTGGGTRFDRNWHLYLSHQPSRRRQDS